MLALAGRGRADSAPPPVAGQDVELAKRALHTYEYGKAPDIKQLYQNVKDGCAFKAYDESGRQYIIDGLTEIVYCPSLYRETTQTKSANLNHLGLTDSDYCVVRAKGLHGLIGGTTVLKRGGTLKSELAGYLSDKLRDKTAGCRH